MKNWKTLIKSGLSLTLAFMVCVGTLPLTAFAADAEDAPASEEAATEVTYTVTKEGSTTTGEGTLEDPEVTKTHTEATGSDDSTRVTDTTVTKDGKTTTTETKTTTTAKPETTEPVVVNERTEIETTERRRRCGS